MCLVSDSVRFQKSMYLFYLFVCHTILSTDCKNTIFSDYLCNDMAERQTIWDPLRKKEVTLTPEERVRQWCIGVLAQQMEIPLHMMMSEAGFRLGDKQFRADILVYDRSAQPLMVVECKRPEVELTEEVLDQAVRYNMVLNVRYMIITNGTRTYMFKKNGDGYSFMNTVPKYNEMLCQQ